MKLSEIKPNPNNPRLIKDDQFKKLVKSMIDFPEMTDVRPVVINMDNVILGGNMRYKAAKEAGLKEIPTVQVDWSEEKQREFIIKDNLSGGEWDFDMLSGWDELKLGEWGIDFGKKEEIKIQTLEIVPYIKSHILISYPPELHSKVNEAIELLLQESGIEIERSSN